MPISLGFWEWGCPNLCNIGVGNYESPVYHEDVFVSHTTLLPVRDETKTVARKTSWGLSACGTDWQCCGTHSLFGYHVHHQIVDHFLKSIDKLCSQTLRS